MTPAQKQKINQLIREVWITRGQDPKDTTVASWEHIMTDFAPGRVIRALEKFLKEDVEWVNPGKVIAIIRADIERDLASPSYRKARLRSILIAAAKENGEDVSKYLQVATR